jgi:hypothetical protein
MTSRNVSQLKFTGKRPMGQPRKRCQPVKASTKEEGAG